MVFENVESFLQMGKHGVYVWSAYGCFVLVLLVNVWHLRINNRKALKQILEVID